MKQKANRFKTRVFLFSFAGLWLLALAYSVFSGRALFADGSYGLLLLLTQPFQFNDYDSLRTFASFIWQAPVLLGQRLGVDSVSWYAALFSVGIFVLPAFAMLLALYLSRKQDTILAANCLAVVVFGFGCNFIVTEANLLFGFVCLSVTILSIDNLSPLARGILLPLLALSLLRIYEGMLLVGPVLAMWSVVAALRTTDPFERTGLIIAAIGFVIGSLIGLGGFLSPRDPENAAGFIASMPAYFGSPQLFLALSALFAVSASFFSKQHTRRSAAVVSMLFGAISLQMVLRLEGYYSYSVYYTNRSLLVLLLPVYASALFIGYWRKQGWFRISAPKTSYTVLMVPFLWAIAGDLVGTYRWNTYTEVFCTLLEKDLAPQERFDLLMNSGSRTGWGWTHPSLSILLRNKDSNAIISNGSSYRGWEPFEADHGPRIEHRGICQSPILGH